LKKILPVLSIWTTLQASIVVSDIEFKGLYHLSQNSAMELLEFEKNSYVSEREIDKSIKKLFKQNYFADIYVDYIEKDEKIIFNFTEKQIISKVAIEGFLDSDEKQQQAFLEIRKGSFLDKHRVENTKNKIIEAMNFKGTVDNRVEVKQELLDNKTVQLEFIAREGEEIVIDSLKIDGVKSLDFDDIEDVMTNREKEGFGWLFGRNSGEMKIKELKIDSSRIQEIYLENGFLDVKVSKPFSDIDFNRYRASVKFKVTEGKQYSVDDIGITINNEVINIDEATSSLLLQKGDKFNIKRFRKDLKKLKALVADKGYAYVEISPDLDKNSENSKVSITYNIKTNKLIKIRNVIISGNRVTLDKVVRREIYLAPNDLYNLTDLMDSKNALGRLGYFEDIQIEEKRVSDTEMDLIVKVKEGRTGMIQIGGGYSSYLGLTFDAGINDRNVFGSGMGIGFSLQYSKISTNYSLTLTNPRINDSLYNGSISLNHSKMEYSQYTVKDMGFGLSVGRRFTRNIRGNVSYRYSDIGYSDIDSDLLYRDGATDSYIKSAISFGSTYDSTDDYYVPRKGVVLSDNIEFAGVGGNAQFVKNTLSFNIYKGLEDYIDYDLILRYKSKLSSIGETRILGENNIPLYESIYMGGVGSVRGYDSYSFPNRDIKKYKDVRALRSFTNSVEASIPISKRSKLRLTGFIDYGWIGVDDFEMANRGGYGVSIDWISPMAPIQFIFSRPFNDKVGDDISKFEFTMGRRF